MSTKTTTRTMLGSLLLVPTLAVVLVGCGSGSGSDLPARPSASDGVTLPTLPERTASPTREAAPTTEPTAEQSAKSDPTVEVTGEVTETETETGTETVGSGSLSSWWPLLLVIVAVVALLSGLVRRSRRSKDWAAALQRSNNELLAIEQTSADVSAQQDVAVLTVLWHQLEPRLTAAADAVSQLRQTAPGGEPVAALEHQHAALVGLAEAHRADLANRQQPLAPGQESAVLAGASRVESARRALRDSVLVATQQRRGDF